MDLLDNAYDTNSDSEQNDGTDDAAAASTATAKVQRPNRRFLRAAPSISIMTRRNHGHELIVHNDPNNHSLEITEPIQGPRVDDPSVQKNQLARFDVEKNASIDTLSFAKQRKQFQRTGQAVGPDQTTTVVRTTLGYNSNRLQQFELQEQERQKRQRELYGSDDDASGTSDGKGKKKKNRAKEPLVYGSDDEAVYGVWAPPSKEERWNADNALTDIQKGGVDSLAPEQLAEREYIKERDRLMGEKEDEKEEISGFERLMERKMAHLLPPKVAGDDQPMEPTKTTFHGESETDYKGRSWMAPPPGMSSVLSLTPTIQEKMDDHKCFVPKKCVHRYTGHNKGVQRIRLFPKTGHLLLSAGLDGKCKIWSTGEAGQRKVMRTYEGHKAAVRDVQFNHDGSRFVSASFDRFLRLWDTESGKVLQTFGNKKVPYCVEFYPKDDNFFVVGTSDNKIITYDCTTGEITQEYNHHLAPVNAVAFVQEDNGNVKMISSSDDKKVLVWEWDIGVPIKYISDPTMHSMPSLAMHPSQQYLVGQSLDNNIVCFQVGQKFKLSKKKKFSGHQVAGYACEPSFSPDGRFLMSGDGKGKIFFWDWKRQKTLQKYKAHDSGPTIACVWHPLEPSVAFTCGWDGVIKMWQ
jgi:pre-mRNA-processing factor 17